MSPQGKRRSTLSLILLFPLLLFSQKEEALDSISMYLDFEEVVVTAQYAPTSSKNALQNIRTISRERIESQGATNLEQLLQQDLGIRIQQDLVLGSSMSLLGLGGENIKIMIDGVPVIGRLDGNIDLSQINLNNIERVEIVEGPMAVSYGTDALAGVINLITKKSQLNDYELSLTQQLETRGESNSMVDAGIRFHDHWLLRINGGRDEFRGFDSADERSSLWNPKKQWYTDVSLRRNLGEDHQLRYQFSFFDEEVKNLGEIRRPQFNPYAFDDDYLTRRISHTLAHEGTFGQNYYWQTVTAFNDFKREVNSYRLDFEPATQSWIGGDTTTFTGYMLRSVLASKFRQSAVNFQLGIDLRYENGSGARLIDPATDSPGKIGVGDYALFGSIRYQPITSLVLEGGLRATRNTRYQAPLIPSVHLKYSINPNLTLRASYGKGFRSPSLKELFLSFIDINHFIIGNPDLIAEQSDNVQLNLTWKKKIRDHRLSLRLNSFYNRIKNQILLFPFIEQDGVLSPVGSDQSSTFAYFNMEKGKNKGAQLKLGYQYKRFSIEGGLLTIGYFNPLSETIRSVDPFTYSTEMNARLAYRIPFTGTDVSFFVRHNDRFISYYPETEGENTVARQRVQDGFTMLDASLSQSFFNNRLSISAGVRNLLDIQQLNVSGGSTGAHSSGSGVPVGVGRSFFVRASIKLFDKGGATFVNRPFEKQQKEALQLHTDQKGKAYASWIENRNDEEKVLQFAEWKKGQWSNPKTISIGQDQWFVNEIDAPQLSFLPNKKQTLLASWLEGSNPRNVYDHHVLMSLSNSAGKRWKPAFMPYESEVPAYYGLVKMIPLSKNSFLVTWLDGRQTKQKSDKDNRYHPKAGTTLTIESLEVDASGRSAHPTTVVDGIQGLCPFDLAKVGEGAVLAYRGLDNDIYVKSYEASSWTDPVKLARDNWSTTATMEAPSVDVSNKNIAIAWFTAPEKKPVIKLSFSENEGKQFSEPLIMPTTEPLGYLELLWAGEDMVVLSWMEAQEEEAILHLAVVDKNGQLHSKQALASFTKNVRLVKPRMALAAEDILLTVKDPNGRSPRSEELPLNLPNGQSKTIRFFTY